MAVLKLSPSAGDLSPISSPRKRPPFASDEKRRQALELFEHGIGYTRASRILDLSVNTLRDWNREYRKGKFHTERSPSQYRYSDDVKKYVIRMRLTGSTWSEITEKSGISASTCRKWVLDYTEKRKARKRTAKQSSEA